MCGCLVSEATLPVQFVMLIAFHFRQRPVWAGLCSERAWCVRSRAGLWGCEEQTDTVPVLTVCRWRWNAQQSLNHHLQNEAEEAITVIIYVEKLEVS